mgnify:CR=1 FL=1
MNVMIIGGNFSYNEMFLDRGFSLVYNIEEADLIQFTGGADVSPVLYEEERHPSTGSSDRRDKEEMHIYAEARKWNIPVAGICRGGQFLNVMNGGKMYQHVNGHAISGTHVMITEDGRDVNVTSTHHQMMSYDFGVGEIVCTAKESVRKESMRYGKLNSVLSHIDVEVVWHGNTKCLCFQPHPELRGADSTYLYFKNLMERYL